MNPDQKSDGNAAPDSGWKPVLLCADDFGMSAAVDAAILDLAARGRLSATSCMSTARAFGPDARQLAALPVATGLHLNLTEAAGGNGFCQPLPRLIRNCYARRIDPDLIRSEIACQLDAFESALGRAPDYVDGHQHVHQLPIVRDCLVEILLQRYPQRLPWLRSTRAGAQPGMPAAIRIKAAVIEVLGAHALQALARRHGFRTNARLLGVYGFAGGEQRYAALLEAWIGAAGAYDLIMCHPALATDDDDPLNRQRRAEYAALAGAALPAALERHRAFVAGHPQRDAA
jgi:chitin disaccharide deacetylase